MKDKTAPARALQECARLHRAQRCHRVEALSLIGFGLRLRLVEAHDHDLLGKKNARDVRRRGTARNALGRPAPIPP